MADIFMPAPEPKTELGRYRILSSTAGVRVSPLQLGAMSIGDAWAKFMGSMDKAQSFSKSFRVSSKICVAVAVKALVAQSKRMLKSHNKRKR
jgi:hypothetical protein